MDAKIRAAGQAIVELRDRNREAQYRHADIRNLSEWYGGMADGLDLALATLAGVEGYGHRLTLEAQLAAAITPPAAAVRPIGLGEDELPTRTTLDYFPGTSAGTPEAEVEPVGGWEPRS